MYNHREQASTECVFSSVDFQTHEKAKKLEVRWVLLSLVSFFFLQFF